MEANTGHEKHHDMNETDDKETTNNHADEKTNSTRNQRTACIHDNKQHTHNRSTQNSNTTNTIETKQYH